MIKTFVAALVLVASTLGMAQEPAPAAGSIRTPKIAVCCSAATPLSDCTPITVAKGGVAQVFIDAQRK